MDKQKPITVIEFCSYMKRVFPDYLENIQESDFYMLESYLVNKKYKANQILKHPDQTEVVSRLVLSGFGVIMEKDAEGEFQVDRAYKQGEVLMDFFSFKLGIPTPSLIKSYSEMTVAELTRDAERALLLENPKLSILSTVINSHIFLIEKAWIKILNAPNTLRYEMFLHNFKLVSNHIKLVDLAQLLKMGYSTLKEKRNQAANKVAVEKQKKKVESKPNPPRSSVYGYTCSGI